MGEEIGIPAIDINDVSKDTDKFNVIYMGWIMANRIKGLKKCSKLFNVAAACCVGMRDPEDGVLEKIKSENKISEYPVFYLHGGLNKDKLSGVKKLIVDVVEKGVKRSIRDGSTKAKDQKMLEIIENKQGYVDVKNLDPVIDWYRYDWSR